MCDVQCVGKCDYECVSERECECEVCACEADKQVCEMYLQVHDPQDLKGLVTSE